MGLIIHRCKICAHPDFFHGADDCCSWGNCRQGRHPLAPGWSEYLMTYDGRGHITPTMTRPGSNFANFGRYAFTTCGCEHCWTLYRLITAKPAVTS